jgi:hypothetical protein
MQIVFHDYVIVLRIPGKPILLVCIQIRIRSIYIYRSGRIKLYLPKIRLLRSKAIVLVKEGITVNPITYNSVIQAGKTLDLAKVRLYYVEEGNIY